MKQTLPLKLQFFAESGTDTAGGAGQPDVPQNNQQKQQSTKQGDTTGPSFDYDKLAGIISGAQAAKEDIVLKNYFKQQGLSQEEAVQAMQEFKTQRAQNQPDVTGLQTQLTALQETAQRAMIENAAMLEAVGLGLDAKTIPYILKMADFKDAVGEKGEVNKENIKSAISKVLEDVPQFKPAQEQQRGFQIGSSGQQNPGANEDALKKAFGL